MDPVWRFLLDFDGYAAIGTVAFAISGYLSGVRKHLDLLGIIIVTLLTAIGGGIIRDVLVGRMPQVFLGNTSLVIIAGAMLFALAARLHKREYEVLTRLFIIADSIGLVAFSLAGAKLGVEYHINAFGVILLGFVTAVGGGIVRDMMVNDVPFILHKDFYGTVSILVASVLYVLAELGWDHLVAVQLVFAGGVALRLLAHWSELTLPKIAGRKKG
ncbi:trimeric intracellular cation channel family protein [Vogesella sp. GCM10023246]|uniref:Trimeric intracellular cation channel family protein n=1 Tax=Vogesella oryzagri TaxID=3160864 RepID=A0ABV1LZQ1_9NEIS